MSQEPSASRIGLDADSLIVLARVLASSPHPADLDVIRPAFYLAQSGAGCTVYPFRLHQGYVVSEELAEDYGQLRAAVESGVRLDALRLPNRRTATLSSAVADRLSPGVHRMLDEDLDALDAAATTLCFRRKSLGEPSRLLTWFRDLSPAAKDRARRLLEDTDRPAEPLAETKAWVSSENDEAIP